MHAESHEGAPLLEIAACLAQAVGANLAPMSRLPD